MSPFQNSYEKPAVCVSRWRNVIGCLGLRVRALPAASNPSRTSTLARSGTHLLAGLSRSSLPRSTSCMAQAPVSAFVIEAIQTTVSVVMAAS